MTTNDYAGSQTKNNYKSCYSIELIDKLLIIYQLREIVNYCLIRNIKAYKVTELHSLIWIKFFKLFFKVL